MTALLTADQDGGEERTSCLLPSKPCAYRDRILEKLDLKNDVEQAHYAIKHSLL
jgi:predicted metal-binding transcription factor (methanogenesis marker protein 9)